MFKSTLKSETMWVSYALVVLGIVEVNYKLLAPLIPEQYYGLFVTGVGIMIALLRMRTTKPLKDL